MKSGPIDKLHDFYQPLPPSWMPQTIGWYIVFGLVALLLAWVLWRACARWHQNRYRREALRELEYAHASAIPALLKRTALAAWPRETVASLSGEPWLNFLEAHGGSSGFSKDAGYLLLDLDYGRANLTTDNERALRRLAGDWIRRHRVHA